MGHAPPAQPTNKLALLKDGAALEGIEVAGGRNTENRALYFDNLAFYQEGLPPLKFEPRPARPFDPFPGRNAGPEHRARATSLSHAATKRSCPTI